MHKRDLSRWLILGLLLVGWAYRLSFLCTTGFGTDLQMFVTWARVLTRSGFAAVYETFSAYPPLGTWLLWPMGQMCPTCPLESAPHTLELLALRWLCSAFDLYNAALLWRWGYRRTRRRWAGALAAAVYLCFPVMPLLSAWWGQTDSAYLTFMLLCGMTFTEKKPSLAWGALALAILIKLQAIILLPVLAAATWRQFGVRRTLLGGVTLLVIVLVSCTPLLLPQPGGNSVGLDAILAPIRQQPLSNKTHLALGGHNLWSALALWRDLGIWDSYLNLVAPHLNFYVAGMVALPLGLLAVALRIFLRYHPRQIFTALALSWLIFFQLAVGSGVRYLLPAAVLLLPAAFESPMWWPVALGLWVSTFFNMQDSITLSQYPLFHIPIAVNLNILWTGAVSLIALAFYGQRDRHASSPPGIERGLALVAGSVMAAGVLTWGGIQVAAQWRFAQQYNALSAAAQQQVLDSGPTLVVNWPKQVSRRDGTPLGVFPPRLPDAWATQVIYTPWEPTFDMRTTPDTQVTDYHGLALEQDPLRQAVRSSGQVATLVWLPDEPRFMTVYRTVPAAPAAVLADFSDVQLLSATLALEDGAGLAHLTWRVVQPPAADVTVFVHGVDPQGQLVAQADGDPVVNLAPFAQWAGGPAFEELRVLPLPPTPAAGVYRLHLGLYHRDTGARLPAMCTPDRRCPDDAVTLQAPLP